MKELSAGQSIKQMITNKDWWKGVFGNMLSTIIGIGLTIGIGALVQLHNDRKLAREMMFTVVETCDYDCETIHSYDSIFKVHEKAIVELSNLYLHNGKDFNKVPADSLQKYIDMLFTFKVTSIERTYVESYFFSAQMMHQFGNAEKYSEYAAFVKQDQNDIEKIHAVEQEWTALTDEWDRLTIDDPEVKNGSQALQKMMEGHALTKYRKDIINLGLSKEVRWFKNKKKCLLNAAGATEEEYEDYLESIDDADDLEDESFRYSSGTGSENSSTTIKARNRKK